MRLALHGTDELGLRRVLRGPGLKLAAGCMAFLAGLAGAADLGAARLAAHWRAAGRAVTVQVPEPDDDAAGQARAAAVAALLPPDARRLPPSEVAGLLRPWLGEDAANLPLRLPAVFSLSGPLPATAEARLLEAAPGTLVAHDPTWQDGLARLAASLQACAGCALAAAAVAAGCVVAVAAQAGLAAGREAIGIVHGLGATDAMIAGRFARRLAGQTGGGALLGALASAPVLLWLARLTAPLRQTPPALTPAWLPALTGLPASLWAMLAALPLLAALIGWISAQATVRAWLARLP